MNIKKYKFKINNKDVTLNDLLKMNTALGNLYTAISSKNGDPLMDFTVPAKFFQAMTWTTENEPADAGRLRGAICFP